MAVGTLHVQAPATDLLQSGSQLPGQTDPLESLRVVDAGGGDARHGGSGGGASSSSGATATSAMGRESKPKIGKKKGGKGGAAASASAAAGGGGGKSGLVMIDPLDVRFTHSRIRPRFSGCNKTIEETKQEIKDGVITPFDLPPITVMLLEDGKTFCSLNNRRLFVLKWARRAGLLPGNAVGVRVKPVDKATRHAAKYSLERCAAEAKLMREGNAGGGGKGGTGGQGANGDGDGTDDEVKNDDGDDGDGESAGAADTGAEPADGGSSSGDKASGGSAAAAVGAVAAGATPASAAGSASAEGTCNASNSGGGGDDGCGDAVVLKGSTAQPEAGGRDGTQRQPSVFFCHGGGPMPLLGDAGHKPLVDALGRFASSLAVTPVAVLVVTAHWEASAGPLVTKAERPELIYDYYGFPPESYEVKYDAPGAPILAEKAAALLRGAGFADAKTTDRGWDHGTFVPLKIAFPDADVPVLQVSVLATQDAGQHLALGRALASLRDEGVLVVGSGMSYHNFAGFRSGGGGADPHAPASKRFDEWLNETCVEVTPAERDARLSRWATAPSARECHPPGQAEHLMPLMVAAGAAGGDSGVQIFHQEDFFGRFALSAWRFG